MIRTVLFRGRMKGKGIVNYDSRDQKWVLRERFPEQRDYLQHDNVKIAKHTFYVVGKKNDSPVWEKRLYISADCLRQAIFGDDFPFQNTMIMQHPDLLLRVIATIPALVRGYFYAEEGKTALKRKSPLMITGAEQVAGGVSHFEINTMSGQKRQKEDVDEASDISMHYEEKIGDVEYIFDGAVDVRELQFISMSETYDRLAVNPDQCEKYRQYLKAHLGTAVGDMKYYQMKSAVIKTPEEGILLTQEQVVKIIQELVKRILSLRIQRSKGYAQISSLEVKLMTDPFDNMEDEGGWFAIRKPQDLQIRPKDIELFYEPVAEKEAIALFETMKKNQADQGKKKKETKEARKRGGKSGTKSADSKV